MGQDYHRSEKELALRLARLRLRMEDCCEDSELPQPHNTLADEKRKPEKGSKTETEKPA